MLSNLFAKTPATAITPPAGALTAERTKNLKAVANLKQAKKISETDVSEQKYQEIIDNDLIPRLLKFIQDYKLNEIPRSDWFYTVGIDLGGTNTRFYFTFYRYYTPKQLLQVIAQWAEFSSLKTDMSNAQLQELIQERVQKIGRLPYVKFQCNRAKMFYTLVGMIERSVVKTILKGKNAEAAVIAAAGPIKKNDHKCVTVTNYLQKDAKIEIAKCPESLFPYESSCIIGDIEAACYGLISIDEKQKRNNLKRSKRALLSKQKISMTEDSPNSPDVPESEEEIDPNYTELEELFSTIFTCGNVKKKDVEKAAAAKKKAKKKQKVMSSDDSTSSSDDEEVVELTSTAKAIYSPGKKKTKPKKKEKRSPPHNTHAFDGSEEEGDNENSYPEARGVSLRKKQHQKTKEKGLQQELEILKPHPTGMETQSIPIPRIVSSGEKPNYNYNPMMAMTPDYSSMMNPALNPAIHSFDTNVQNKMLIMAKAASAESETHIMIKKTSPIDLQNHHYLVINAGTGFGAALIFATTHRDIFGSVAKGQKSIHFEVIPLEIGKMVVSCNLASKSEYDVIEYLNESLYEYKFSPHYSDIVSGRGLKNVFKFQKRRNSAAFKKSLESNERLRQAFAGSGLSGAESAASGSEKDAPEGPTGKTPNFPATPGSHNYLSPCQPSPEMDSLIATSLPEESSFFFRFRQEQMQKKERQRKQKKMSQASAQNEPEPEEDNQEQEDIGNSSDPDPETIVKSTAYSIEAWQTLMMYYKYLFMAAQNFCITIPKANGVFICGDNQVKNLEFFENHYKEFISTFKQHPKSWWLDEVSFFYQKQPFNFSVEGLDYFMEKEFLSRKKK